MLVLSALSLDRYLSEVILLPHRLYFYPSGRGQNLRTSSRTPTRR
jgi:hypothetical protein